jgi:hypothetical protein
MTDQRREEAEETAAWAIAEANRLRTETERMRKVHDLAKAVVNDSDLDDRDDTSSTVESKRIVSLREALYSAEVAEWKAGEPERLLDVPEWLIRRPVQGDEVGSRALHSWCEDGAAVVTDGNGLLHVPGAVVPERDPYPLREDGLGTAARVMKDTDWNSSTWILHDDLLAERERAAAGGTRLAFGAALVDPLLIEHFVPRLTGERLYVSVGGVYEPVGFRAVVGGAVVFRAVVMPIRDWPGEPVRIELKTS